MADEKIEVVVARIDENVKAIKDDITDMKNDCDKDMADHENRIRDNEKFKQRGYGALGIIAATLTILGGLLVKIIIG
jgi:t-SNARE complex subunit (syntaxin)